MEVRNRFKGLDLIDRVPDELWNEVRDTVQERGIRTIPMEKKCKKAKWLSEEALQIAVKRREAKSKGEKETYKHLHADFQRTARRDKKAFFMIFISYPHVTTGKTIDLTIQTFVSKVMSLLFNMLARLDIAVLPKSKSFNCMAAVTICSAFGVVLVGIK